jgi:hypothetical protein
MGEVMIEASPYVVEKFDRDRFEHFWPEISKELDTVPQIWADRWTKESIYQAVMMEHFQCWAAGDDSRIRVVMFTQVAVYPACNVLQVMIAFGNGIVKMLPSLDATMERFALACDCASIEIVGRPGWDKSLEPLGFKRTAVVVSRKLQPMRMN